MVTEVYTESRQSLAETKTWGLCFENMVWDCKKCVTRTDAKQCFEKDEAETPQLI